MTTSVNNTKSVNVVANANVVIEKPATTKRATLNKNLNKGAKDIMAKCQTIGQTLKLLHGIENDTLESTDGMTVRTWFEAVGVKFDAKGKVTPAAIKAAWAKSMMVNGVMCVYKNVPAFIKDGEPGDVDAARLKVYDKDWKVVAQYELVPIGATEWNMRTILKGLRQSLEPKKHADKAAASVEAFEKLPKVYTVTTATKKNRVQKLVEANKSLVQF